jgi:hypothetical protein
VEGIERAGTGLKGRKKGAFNLIDEFLPEDLVTIANQIPRRGRVVFTSGCRTGSPSAANRCRPRLVGPRDRLIKANGKKHLAPLPSHALEAGFDFNRAPSQYGRNVLRGPQPFEVFPNRVVDALVGLLLILMCSGGEPALYTVLLQFGMQP